MLLAFPSIGQAKRGAEDLPKFADFPVSVSMATNALRLEPDDQMYRTRYRHLYEAGKQSGPNFAGHFAVTDVGCGTSCTFLLAVDLKTGRTVGFDVPQGESLEYCDDAFADKNGDVPGQIGQRYYFKDNSRLFVVTGKMAGNECGARYFVERNGKLKMIRDFQLPRAK